MQRKLTADQVREIRRRRHGIEKHRKAKDQASSIKALAARFGVADRVIRRAAAGETYKEVPFESPEAFDA